MNDIDILKEFIEIDRRIRNNKVESDYDEFCERRCIAIENTIKKLEELTIENEKLKKLIGES